MVYLVLKNAGRPSLGRPTFPFTVGAKSFNLDCPKAENIGREAWYAEAAFLLDDAARRGRAEGRVDDCLERIRIPLAGLAQFGTQMARPVIGIFNDEVCTAHSKAL